MAAEVFNTSKGKFNEYVDRVANDDPADSVLIVVLLRNSVANSVLRDFNDLAAILADPGVDEANFTNYTRKSLTDADVTAPTPDDVNDRQDADIPNQTWTAAGGAVNNNLVKLLVCYADAAAAADANIIPVSLHDFVAVTDGNNLIAEINSAGFARAA